MHPLHDERLHDYLDGRLPPAERAAFERALASDPALAAALAQLRAVSLDVRELPRLAAPLALRAAIRTELAARPVATLWPRWLDRQLLAAGLVGAVLLGGALVIGRDGDAPAQHTIATSPRDAEGAVSAQLAKRDANTVLRDDGGAAGSVGLAFGQPATKESADSTRADLALLKTEETDKSTGKLQERPESAGTPGPLAEGAEPANEPERLRKLGRHEDRDASPESVRPGDASKDTRDGAPHLREGAQGGAGPAGAAPPAGAPAAPAPVQTAGSGSASGLRGAPKPAADSPRFGGRTNQPDAPGEPGLDRDAPGDKAKQGAPHQDGTTDAGAAHGEDAAKNRTEVEKALAAGSGSGDGQAAGGGMGARMARRAAGAAGSADLPVDDAHEQEVRDRSTIASARPLDVATTEPERLVVLLEDYAQRNGLAIRRVNTADGAVVELADLTREQLAALRPLMRRLETARSDEAGTPDNAAADGEEHQDMGGSDAAARQQGDAKRQPGAPAAERADKKDAAAKADEANQLEAKKGAEGQSRAEAKSPDRSEAIPPRASGPPQADPAKADPPKPLPPAEAGPPPPVGGVGSGNAPRPGAPGAPPAPMPPTPAPGGREAAGAAGSAAGKPEQKPTDQHVPPAPPRGRGEPAPANRGSDESAGRRPLPQGDRPLTGGAPRDPAGADDDHLAPDPERGLEAIEEELQKLGKAEGETERRPEGARLGDNPERAKGSDRPTPRYSLRIVIRLAK